MKAEIIDTIKDIAAFACVLGVIATYVMFAIGFGVQL